MDRFLWPHKHKKLILLKPNYLIMSIKSLVKKFKAKQTTKRERKQILKQTEHLAYKEERVVIKARKKAADADKFLQKVEAAKRKGAKMATVGKRRYQIKSIILIAKKKKATANKVFKSAENAFTKADRVSKKMEDCIERCLLEPNSKSKPKPPRPVQTTTKKDYKKYVVTHTPTGKTRTVHASGYSHAKEMVKQILGLSSINKLVAKQE